jgi:HEAT repeat protein
MLAVGSLRSDGLAPETADLVLQHPRRLPELVAALQDPVPEVRGHAADALERVARHRPGDAEPYLSQLIIAMGRDDVAMVRWHMAMILTWVTRTAATARRTIPALLHRLEDPNALVRAWSISGLCVLGRVYGDERRILTALGRLELDRSIAVRHRAATAVALLLDPDKPVPRSWVKTSTGHAGIARGKTAPR